MGEGGGRAAPLFACQSAQKDGCAQRTGAHARPEPTSSLYTDPFLDPEFGFGF
jgi:hypothetical protein